MNTFIFPGSISIARFALSFCWADHLHILRAGFFDQGTDLGVASCAVCCRHNAVVSRFSLNFAIWDFSFSFFHFESKGEHTELNCSWSWTFPVTGNLSCALFKGIINYLYLWYFANSIDYTYENTYEINKTQVQVSLNRKLLPWVTSGNYVGNRLPSSWMEFYPLHTDETSIINKIFKSSYWIYAGTL